MHYAVARFLYEAGALERFHTDLYLTRFWRRVLAAAPADVLPAPARRMQSRGAPLPDSVVRAYPWFGLTYALRTRRASDIEAATRAFVWAGKAFGANVTRHGFEGASAVYTYNTAGVEILEAAKRRGLFTVVEQTIVPRAIEARLMAAEQRRYPTWEPPVESSAAIGELADREAREWSLADVIVCGSEFVRDGMRELGAPVERTVVVPYGVDMPAMPAKSVSASSPLRILLVGHVSLRKGAPAALAIARRLQGLAEFRWVGPIAVREEAHAAMRPYIDLRGAVPRADVAAHYQWADVFLLPSVCEGSATVSYEALRSGLPVITTRAAGSPVRHEVDGFVTASDDTDAMVAAITALSDDRERLREMSAAALAGAEELGARAYRDRLLPVLMGPSWA